MDIFFAIGIIAIGIGTILSTVGSIWLLILAFREGTMWGLAAMFVPFVMLVFVIMYFGETWQPMVINLLGGVIATLGLAILYFAVGPELLLG
ncbi:MAG: hypothetical protein DWQ07_01680 [Chloroflexi bacterium]|nr:MAG: hypothetical protein DWQ07_01680 [Chloroflexota bacterium]MBL1193792.1 hypothetical protein [Chloroflexota bacterium]NOH11085.1 hypothetical protein [Chloroflexota bacterium]